MSLAFDRNPAAKLAYDGASKGVRVAVLRGLRQLVDNQNAQPVLKVRAQPLPPHALPPPPRASLVPCLIPPVHSSLTYALRASAPSSKSTSPLQLASLRALARAQKALTGVTALLHDAEPVVREALMDLVLAVTNCRDFKFWELIAPEALLEAVAADGDEGVARKIVRLLLPSYFPNADSGAVSAVHKNW